MGQVDRREFLGLLAGGSALAGLSSCMSPGRGGGGAKRPNIIYIMSDDHAAHALSCYGSRINKTPHLDRLAREGMRFDHCYATNSLCAPSRATILTGKYNHVNGLLDNRVIFDGRQETFPKILRRHGYQTAMIGKWHLKSTPTGFDYWNVLPGQGRYHDPVLIEMGERKVVKGYVTDLLTDIAIDFLEKKRDPNKPFLMMLHHKAPHRNWQPDKKHAHLYDNVEIPTPPTFDDDHSHRASPARTCDMSILHTLTVNDVKAPFPKGLTPHQLKVWKYERFIKDYLRCIASVDENVGRLLDYLDRSGLAENTMVVYTSDQGFFLGDHGWFDKRFFYEESDKMPLLIRFPGRVKPGSVNKDLVSNVDFAPTFLDVAGAPIPPDMQGRSFKPLLFGEHPAGWRKSFYYHYYEFPAEHKVRRHYGVRTDRYKLIYYYRIGEWELFDLKKDPHELRSVYDDPAYGGVQRRLKAELKRLRRELGDRTGAPSRSCHPDFVVTPGAYVRSAPEGYWVSSLEKGYALKKLQAPLRGKVRLQCEVKPLTPWGQRNGFIVFGPSMKAEELVSCGIFFRTGELVVRWDDPKGKPRRKVLKVGLFPKGRPIRLEIDVDLDRGKVTVRAAGKSKSLTVSPDLSWKEIRYLGYGVNHTQSSFGPIQAS